MANTTARWTLSIARDILAEQQNSGMCLAQFAQARGLNPKRLYRWRQRLSVAEGSPTPRPTPPAKAQLVPVEVVPARAAPADELTGTRARLSLRTAGGYAVDIAVGFDGDTLLRILDVLAEAERC